MTSVAKVFSGALSAPVFGIVAAHRFATVSVVLRGIDWRWLGEVFENGLVSGLSHKGWLGIVSYTFLCVTCCY